MIKTDLEMSVSVRVNICRGLIDQDDLARREDSSGEAEELLLTCGEAAALLSDLTTVT